MSKKEGMTHGQTIDVCREVALHISRLTEADIQHLDHPALRSMRTLMMLWAKMAVEDLKASTEAIGLIEQIGNESAINWTGPLTQPIDGEPPDVCVCPTGACVPECMACARLDGGME